MRHMDIEDLRNPHLHRQGIVHETARIKAVIEELFESFPGHKPQKTITRWTRRLAEKGYLEAEVKNAVEYCISTLTKIPSISELETIIANHSPRVDKDKVAEERQNLQDAEGLRKWAEKEREKFLEHHSEEELIMAMRKWWIAIYNSDPSEYGLGLRVFMPIFFQDMNKAGNKLSEAIRIGKERI